jgi:hypothetical protein
VTCGCARDTYIVGAYHFQWLYGVASSPEFSREWSILQSSPENGQFSRVLQRKGQFSRVLLRNPNSPESSGDFTRFADVVSHEPFQHPVHSLLPFTVFLPRPAISFSILIRIGDPASNLPFTPIARCTFSIWPYKVVMRRRPDAEGFFSVATGW